LLTIGKKKKEEKTTTRGGKTLSFLNPEPGVFLEFIQELKPRKGEGKRGGRRREGKGKPDRVGGTVATLFSPSSELDER